MMIRLFPMILALALAVPLAQAQSQSLPRVSADSDISADGCSTKIRDAQQTARDQTVDRATNRVSSIITRPASARVAACIDGLLNLPSLALNMDPLGYLSKLISGAVNRAIDRACKKITDPINDLKKPIYDIKIPQIPSVDARIVSGGPSAPSQPGKANPANVDQSWWQRMRANVSNVFSSAPPPQVPGK